MDSELQLLEKDIKKSLKEQHPELVLDRLRTLSVKIIRRFCEENNIAVFNEKNELYPLHSLVGINLISFLIIISRLYNVFHTYPRTRKSLITL